MSLPPPRLPMDMGRTLDAKLAIYDLGGGTFDMTVLHAADNVFEVNFNRR